MRTGKGQVVELILENGLRHARISCPADLIPAPGQYLLAGTASSPNPLPVSLFSTESTLQSFIACPPLPEDWAPGTVITLRGPLGHGFALPASTRKVALVPFDDMLPLLKSLIPPALKQDAAVVLVSDTENERLPDEVEIQPIAALNEILAWADYIVFGVQRENLPEMRERFSGKTQISVKSEAQVLVYTRVPCGGIAECGVCAVEMKSGWKLACKDGPVFDLREIL